MHTRTEPPPSTIKVVLCRILHLKRHILPRTRLRRIPPGRNHPIHLLQPRGRLLLAQFQPVDRSVALIVDAAGRVRRRGHRHVFLALDVVGLGIDAEVEGRSGRVREVVVAEDSVFGGEAVEDGGGEDLVGAGELDGAGDEFVQEGGVVGGEAGGIVFGSGLGQWRFFFNGGFGSGVQGGFWA